MTTLLVAGGGLLGVLARFGSSRLTLHHEGLLWAGVNVAGSFLLAARRRAVAHGDLREAIGVGFLGGLTALSTFSVQVVLEVEAGRLVMAAAYLAASVLGGVLAAAAGFALGGVL